MMMLEDFIIESNRIEGIEGYSSADFEAHETFLQDPVSVETLCNFVFAVTHGRAKLRIHPEMNVRVGAHIAPRGAPGIRDALEGILQEQDPHLQHCRYLTLHPFMDGNGRSARALWLRRRNGIVPRIGFLHTFYYEALSHADGRSS